MARGTGAGAFLMVSLIENFPIRHIESLLEMQVRLLKALADPGGCRYFTDPGLDCFLLPDDDVEWDSRKAQRILKEAVGRAWELKGNEE